MYEVYKIEDNTPAPVPENPELVGVVNGLNRSGAGVMLNVWWRYFTEYGVSFGTEIHLPHEYLTKFQLGDEIKMTLEKVNKD